eukprot:10152220-Lingulodinium_polyedra.AAC.1
MAPLACWRLFVLARLLAPATGSSKTPRASGRRACRGKGLPKLPQGLTPRPLPPPPARAAQNRARSGALPGQLVQSAGFAPQTHDGHWP